jgi:glycosyltransferase involved in cell wall biosynthesis
MPNKPVISVIIPLFNKENYIARALNSVLSQTFKDFEVIVVDDGSTDEGSEIVRDFVDPRIYLIQQPNRGVSAARNKGVEVSSAEMIAFLDSDDEWLPDHLETLLKLRKKYPEAGAYTTAYMIKYPNSKIKTANYHGIPREPFEGIIRNYFKSAALGSAPVQSSVVGIPKSIFNLLGGFKNGVWWGEDTDLWGRIALSYPIAFSWDGRAIQHTEASNRACNKTEPIEETIFVSYVQDAIEDGKISPNIQVDLMEYVARIQIAMALHNIRVGEPRIAQNILKNCKTRYLLKKKYLSLLLAYLPTNVSLFLRSLAAYLI